MAFKQCVQFLIIVQFCLPPLNFLKQFALTVVAGTSNTAPFLLKQPL